MGDEPVAVLHEHVAGIGHDAGLSVRFARQPGIGVGGAGVGAAATVQPLVNELRAKSPNFATM